MTTTPVLLPVWDSLTPAWEKVKGAKKTIWAAQGILFLILIGFAILTAIAKLIHPAFEIVINLISQVITLLLQVGLIYLGIQRASNLPISYDMMFRAFEWDVCIRLFGVWAIKGVIFFLLGLCVALTFLVLPDEGIGLFFKGLFSLIFSIIGIVLLVRLVLAAAFVIDKKTNSWQAIVFSYHATAHNFFRMVGAFLLQFIIIIIAAIPFFIGLIWAIPFSFIFYGVVYNTLSVNVTQSPNE